MAFTGDCSGSAKGTGVPPICNPICIHLVTLSNILCGWRVTIWSCIHYKMNQINTFCFTLEIVVSPRPQRKSGRAHWWVSRATVPPFTVPEMAHRPRTPRKSFHEAPPAPEECWEWKKYKTFGKIYPRSTFVVEYLFNVERGRFCPGFLAAISDE